MTAMRPIHRAIFDGTRQQCGSLFKGCSLSGGSSTICEIAGVGEVVLNGVLDGQGRGVVS